MKKILLFMVYVLLVFSMVSCDQEVKTKTYKVSYNANGAVGNVPATIEVEEGGTTTVPSCGSLSMKGYDFVGWNTKKDGSGKTYEESQFLKVDSDISLYAQWSIHEYSISYDLAEVHIEGRSNPKTYTIETENFTLNNPEKDGYEFLGWKTSENDEPNKNVSISKGTIGDLLFIAVWRPLKSYSISYDVNGGEGSIGTVLKLEGESVEIATASEVSRKGYGFVCWNTESDGTGKDYNPGDLYEEDEDLHLYAKWSIVKYSIEYALNDGKLATGKSNPSEYTVETADIVLENPTKHGYEFVGWRYKDDSDASASTDFSIKKGTTGNLSIVAVWKALGTYTISYDANGGTGTIETQSEYKGTSLTISSGKDIERVGYIFSCWNTEKDGTGKDYKPDDAYNVDADLRLYAQWNPVKYSIKYDLDGGSFSEGSIIAEYTIETDTFILPIPTKVEYEFIGWKTKVSDEVQKAVSIEKGSTGNLSFTAVWRKLNRYTVSYDVNGGSGSIESQSKLEGSSITISDAAGIERAGYSFVCWNTKSDGTGTDYKPSDEYTNDVDLVLYAKWSVVKYSITYDLAGGMLPEEKRNPSDYTIETETFTLVNPEKEGYIFVGWKESGSKDETAEENVSIAKGSSGNKSFIAAWRLPKKCTITFDSNGADEGLAPDQLVIYEGDSFEVPSCGSLGKDGYVFYGWNTDSDGSGTLYMESELIFASNDTVLYAIWRVDPLEYTYLSESDSYSVACNDKSVSSIVIPSMYKGKPITNISYRAFHDCNGLTSVTIPESVTSIEISAFAGCSGLTSITIPSSVTSIGDYVFYDCSGLVSIMIPEGVTSIGPHAFWYCSGLESISVSEGNSKYYAEGNCLIGRDAKDLVLGCKNSVIPEDVTSIDAYAFLGCNGLTNVMIPEGVISIDASAFIGCNGIGTIEVEPGNSVFYSEGDCLIRRSSKTLVLGSNNSVIPEVVERIGYRAFSGRSGLTEILIPESVTRIESNAFAGCSGLKEITIPNRVMYIGDDAFYGCSGLKSVVLNEYVCKELSMSNLFPSAYQTIESVTIPKGVTYIYIRAFQNCSGLTSITIPKGVTYISICSFEGCSSLKEITIPEGVTSILDSAFEGCSGLTGITIPESVTSIGDEAFRGCSGLTSVAIPEGVAHIGNYAFEGCSGLTNVTISEGVETIGSSAFAGCSGLTSITIPGSVASIGNSAFFGCSGLAGSLVIPESVTSIGTGAFSGCCKLASVTIPKSVGNIGEKVFSGCSGLREVTICEGITYIGQSAFFDCKSLNKITIPETVKSIGDSAFSGCSGLESIKLPSIKFINVKVFENCSSLTSMTIPEGVTLIDSGAFKNCKNLIEIKIPSSVTWIGFGVFSSCGKLTNIKFGGTKEQWTSILNYDTGNYTIHCTDGDIAKN